MIFGQAQETLVPRIICHVFKDNPAWQKLGTSCVCDCALQLHLVLTRSGSCSPFSHRQGVGWPKLKNKKYQMFFDKSWEPAVSVTVSLSVPVTVSVTYMSSVKCLCSSLGHAEQLLFSCLYSKLSICNYVTFCMSHVTCHIAHVTCHM